MIRQPRRQVLAGVGTAAATAVAGCSSLPGDDEQQSGGPEAPVQSWVDLYPTLFNEPEQFVAEFEPLVHSRSGLVGVYRELTDTLSAFDSDTSVSDAAVNTATDDASVTQIRAADLADPIDAPVSEFATGTMALVDVEFTLVRNGAPRLDDETIAIRWFVATEQGEWKLVSRVNRSR